MKVIDHQSHHWFFFEEEGAFFLDANCNHSAFGYSWMIELNSDELIEYKSQGREYLSKLADEIHNSAPIAKGNTSKFKDRDVSKNYADKTKAALDKWRNGNAR